MSFIDPTKSYELRTDWLKIEPYPPESGYGFTIYFEARPGKDEVTTFPNYHKIPYERGQIAYCMRVASLLMGERGCIKDGVCYKVFSSHGFQKGPHCGYAYELARRIQIIGASSLSDFPGIVQIRLITSPRLTSVATCLNRFRVIFSFSW